jgi:excisionase family DNA binding protein
MEALLAQELQRMREQIAQLTAVVSKLAERNPEETYLTTEEACAKYKVSASTLFARKRENRINYWQDGRILRWPESELRKFSKLK